MAELETDMFGRPNLLFSTDTEPELVPEALEESTSLTPKVAFLTTEELDDDVGLSNEIPDV